VAETVLIAKPVLASCLLLLVAGCSSSGQYLKKDPRKIGEKVERLHQEVVRALPVRPSSDNGTHDEPCYEDWQKKRGVKPKAGDPWKVDYNQFDFKAFLGIAVREQNSVPAIYGALVQNLQRAGGWHVAVEYNTAGYPGGVGGAKQDVRLNAYDTPDGQGGHLVYVELETDCFRHPNA
jgi:hypothetical protein